MRLFEALNIVTEDNKEMIGAIKEALIDKQEDVELQEPVSDGFFYEKWEEKYEELTCIVDQLEDLEMTDDSLERQKILDKIKTDIKVYQALYSGLKRLVI